MILAVFPRIGISAGEVTNKDQPWFPLVYGQSHTYVDSVASAGGAPFIIPLVERKNTLEALYKSIDGLLLSGGNDISPNRYKEDSTLEKTDYSIRRDEQEITLLKWAIKDQKPVLAICRGMQLLNVAFGGTLYQDIANDLPLAHEHNASDANQNIEFIAHRLEIKAGSRLSHILETESISSNSHHHQAIKSLGSGLVVTAYSEDGLIEAVEMPGQLFVIGVQAHPEALTTQANPLWRKLFTAFIKASSSKARQK